MCCMGRSEKVIIIPHSTNCYYYLNNTSQPINVFKFSLQNEAIVNRATGRCLEMVKANVSFGYTLVLQACTGQKWNFKNTMREQQGLWVSQTHQIRLLYTRSQKSWKELQGSAFRLVACLHWNRYYWVWSALSVQYMQEKLHNQSSEYSRLKKKRGLDRNMCVPQKDWLLTTNFKWQKTKNKKDFAVECHTVEQYRSKKF